MEPNRLWHWLLLHSEWRLVLRVLYGLDSRKAVWPKIPLQPVNSSYFPSPVVFLEWFPGDGPESFGPFKLVIEMPGRRVGWATTQSSIQWASLTIQLTWISWLVNRAVHSLLFPGFGADYEQPRWLFFRGLSVGSVLIFVLLPILIGVLFKKVVQKFSTYYLVSDLFGLLFFQPEITDKRNASFKVASFFLMSTSLVFISFYLASFESQLTLFQTSGGHTIDDGFYQVEIFTESSFYTTILGGTLAFPRYYSEDLWLTPEGMYERIQANPGKYYLMTSPFASYIQAKGKETLLAFLWLLWDFKSRLSL